ncbi:hypothetical protein [Exiguobacterium sp. s154]|uniref:hypothetical protein n=1 Tax=Exiguobacterium sp. s154 TaxID=2751277 RepID=UPI001BEC1240|nr:hypothetical protein [Exiguobacterium sp. s154]
MAEDRKLVEMYLAEQYPDETYSIKTIPFRTDGFEHTNLYTIYVTFTNESSTEYNYRVDEKNPISISGYTGDVRDFRLESTGEQVVVHWYVGCICMDFSLKTVNLREIKAHAILVTLSSQSPENNKKPTEFTKF